MFFSFLHFRIRGYNFLQEGYFLLVYCFHSALIIHSRLRLAAKHGGIRVIFLPFNGNPFVVLTQGNAAELL